MSPTNLPRLVTLGGLTLVADGVDDDLTKRRRKLALLVVLAMSDRPITRDTLVDMFWGEEDEERARHSLSDALSHLRRVLGKDAITARSADIELTMTPVLAVDAREFAAACKVRDFDRAIDLYGGAFLDGVIVDRSPRFDQWCTQVRERLRREFVAACKARCNDLARNREWARCGEIAERWFSEEPASADAALFLMNARKAAGTPDALRDALATYDRIARRLRSEFDMATDKAVVEFAEGVRTALRAMGEPDAPTPAAAPLELQVAPVIVRRFRRWQAFAAAAALVVLAGIVAKSATRSASRDRIVIVVTSIQNTQADTSDAWLAEGVRQMLASSLDRSAKLDVVPPARVRDAFARQGGARGEATELRVARALGATWAVRGGITRGEGAYVLDLTVSDVSTGEPLSTFSVSAQNLISAADHAVTRIRALAAESSGPYFADLETRSVDAFRHFVRSQQASSEGRYTEGDRELDLAIRLDSGFTSAIVARLRSRRGEPRHPDVTKLARLYDRARPRVLDWDRLEQAQYHAFHNGEHDRAEQLAREMLARYPQDPRAYAVLADVLWHHAKWLAADSTHRRLLALDSLAIASGDGPCVPCSAHSGLANLLAGAGDLAGAERLVRRWINLQPDLPSAWADLATIKGFAGDFDAALAAQRRAAELSNGEPEFVVRTGRLLIAARRYREADSAIAVLARMGRVMRDGTQDLRAVLARERGQHRAALGIMEAEKRRLSPGVAGGAVDLVRAQEYALLGDAPRAVQLFESFTHSPRDAEPVSPVMSVAGDVARAFTWHHALMADAVWESADTAWLRAVADSMERIGARSYYARDWRLHRHVRGLIAMRGRRWDEAMRQLDDARWGVSGWTRSLAVYADAALAASRPVDAITALRDAYKGPLDAMGRYLPRSEIDFRMALAFRALGQTDSAATYAGYVRSAWKGADPEWNRRLALLP
jgi:DNA-binding SARP family transcriptional activator/TolB-like protein